MADKVYDVVSIGGATRDIFFRTIDARIVPNPDDRHSRLIAFEFGTKIIPEEVYLTHGGGAHNSSSCFARMGLATAATISVGADGAGRRVEHRLREQGVNTSLIRFDPGVATAISVVIASERDHVSLLFRGANDHLRVDDWGALEGARWLYVTSLTGHGTSLIPEIADFVRSRETRLALNPGSVQLHSGYRGLKDILEVTDVLILNDEESRELVASFEPAVDTENHEALLESLAKMGPGMVVITEGKDGSRCLDSEGIHAQRAIPVDIHDTTGAGDAYGATFVAALLLGLDTPKAMLLASINASSVVSRLGSTEGLLGRTELEKRMVGFKAA